MFIVGFGVHVVFSQRTLINKKLYELLLREFGVMKDEVDILGISSIEVIFALVFGLRRRDWRCVDSGGRVCCLFREGMCIIPCIFKLLEVSP